MSLHVTHLDVTKLTIITLNNDNLQQAVKTYIKAHYFSHKVQASFLPSSMAGPPKMPPTAPGAVALAPTLTGDPSEPAAGGPLEPGLRAETWLSS